MDDTTVKVLVIDDEEMVSRMLRAYLELQGLEVTTAAAGEEALKALAAGRFHAAIVDMRLPDMTGDELIVRATGISSGTHFFIHTGSLDFRLSEKLRELGIGDDDIIQKPVSDMGEIYRAIVRVLGR
jgi:DNA-binding response OmpR family regulator